MHAVRLTRRLRRLVRLVQDGNFVGRTKQVGTKKPKPANDKTTMGYLRELFRPEWEQEFLELEYRYDVFPKWLTYAFFIGAQASLSWTWGELGSQPEHCPINSPFRGGATGRMLVGVPNLMFNWVGTFAIRFIISCVSTEKRSGVYSTLVVLWALILHFSYIFVGLVRELIRGLGGPPVDDSSKCAAIRHVEVHLDYSTWIFLLGLLYLDFFNWETCTWVGRSAKLHCMTWSWTQR